MSLAALSLPPGPGPVHGAEKPLPGPMIVGKAYLNSPLSRQISAGQQALASYMTKKRERYLARKRKSSRQLKTTESADVSYEESVNTSAEYVWSKSATALGATTLGATTLGATTLGITSEERKCILCLATLNLRSSKYKTSGNTAVNPLQKSPHLRCKCTRANKDNLAKLNCKELAEKVVSRAKVRLKHRSKKKSEDILRDIYMPTKRPIKAAGFVRSSTPVLTRSANTTPLSLSPLKDEGASAKSSNLSLNRSFEEPANDLSTSSLRVAKKVICFSEKQSPLCKETGVPNAPPSTPKAGINISYKLIIFLRGLGNCHGAQRGLNPSIQ